MDKKEKISIIESILFASGDAFSVDRLALILETDVKEIKSLLIEMKSDYEFRQRGIKLVFMNNKVQLCSDNKNADYVRRAIEVRKPPALSKSALEVLSIIAYKQPVTKAYIEQIRGVDSNYTVVSLQDKGLVEPCGHLNVPGRPMLFRTTLNFLRIFGITHLEELPELPQIDSEFQQLSF